jgi:hypothetical protein
MINPTSQPNPIATLQVFPMTNKTIIRLETFYRPGSGRQAPVIGYKQIIHL